MDLLLDCADLSLIERSLTTYPVKGVTTNPTMLSKVASSDVLEHLSQIRSKIGHGMQLHVQMMGSDHQTMVKEAHRVCSVLGDETFIAIPVTEEGLKAIRILATESLQITATTVFSTMQGILAMLSGARYVAVFYDRMLNLDIEASRVIKELSGLLWTNTSNTQVLAASFRNVAEITNAYASGAGCCTVKPEILNSAMEMPSITKAVGDFEVDWQRVYGNKTLLDL